uniref:Uncharacterized protein n=1 Tax=Oryza glumipatula TaxID=40148 RepID=A0A0E0B0Z6_9ORYZ
MPSTPFTISFPTQSFAETSPAPPPAAPALFGRRRSRTPQPELPPPLDSPRLTYAHQAAALSGVRRSRRCRLHLAADASHATAAFGASEISVPGDDGLYDYIKSEDHEEKDACEDPVDPLEWDSYGF